MAGSSSYRYHWTFRVVCFLVLLGLAGLQLFIARQEQTEYSSTSDSADLLEYLHSSFLLTWHAKRFHRIEGDMDQAEDLFKRALVQNPLFLPAWLGLAELRNDQGRKSESQAILEYVDQLSTDISRWRWDKALLAYQLDRLDILYRDLSYIIKKTQGKSRQSALKMAFSIWDDPQELLNRMGTQNVMYLFRYAVQTAQVDIALAFWPYIEKILVDDNNEEVLEYLESLIRNGEIAQDTPIWKKYFVLKFLESLIQNGKIAQATPIWKKYFNNQSLLYDGSFQEEPMNTAFGWRVGKPRGSTWRIEIDAMPLWEKYFNSKPLLNDGSFQEERMSYAFGWQVGKPKGSTWRIESDKGEEKSQVMHLHFSGTNNIAFNHLTQIVPLASARKYSLTGWLKTEKLTTDQRPYLEVVGYNCTIAPANTEIVAKSQPWTPFTLTFNVSEDCEAVQVRVRRNPSKHFENLLAGDLWLRDLEIHDAVEIESSPSTEILLHDLQEHSLPDTKP